MNGNTAGKDTLKILLLGDEGCGKTSLLRKYTGNSHNESNDSSVFDCYTASVTLENKNNVELTLWDTSGSKDFDHVRPLSYKDTDVFLLCFDISQRGSLSNVSNKWLLEMFENSPGKPFILVGCKTDLRSDKNSFNKDNCTQQDEFISQSQAVNFAKTIKAFDYVECSSQLKTDELEQLFVTAAKLGIGVNRGQSFNKKSAIGNIDGDKSKCNIS